MISYFYHLSTYSPINSHGSCGYVSLCQYLSYYDCFYNGSIIPEVYEKNQGSVQSLELARLISPGVIRQSYPENGNSLYIFIQNNMDTDYQMKLMYYITEYYNRTSSDYHCRTGMWNYFAVIDEIQALNNTSFTYFSYETLYSGAKPTDTAVVNFFDSFVKNLLDNDIPVILHIGKYNQSTGEIEGCHSVVAYYYNEDGIHANFGWDSQYCDVVISDEYQIDQAGCINFTGVSENHSNNFIVNNATYCGCGYHTAHHYGYSYDTYSSLQHKSYCTCSSYVLEHHSADYARSYFFHGIMYAPCIYCDETIQIGGDGPLHPDPWSINMLVTDNGSYIMLNGIYVIMEEDLEDFLLGLLVFHPFTDISI